MSKLAVVVFLSSALWAGVAAAQVLSVPEQLSVPVDYQGRQIQLRADFYKPKGSGPFPVVIALHGCSGYTSVGNEFLLLSQQGYAILHLDSFTARGYSGGIHASNCDAVTGLERATDALAAAYTLGGRLDVRRDRIAVIGWSHGGWGAALVTQDGPDRRPAREKLASIGGKLVASIDFYGPCGYRAGIPAYPVVVPLLVLVGSLDAGSSGTGYTVAACSEVAKANPTLVAVQVYPGVYHAFDDSGAGQPHNTRDGYIVGYDAAATADAHVRVTEFLRRYMQ
jgi:dienelactone hydrolase